MRKRKGGALLQELELLHTVERPELPGKPGGSSFRAAKCVLFPFDELKTVNCVILM